jgi:hypothetical protein
MAAFLVSASWTLLAPATAEACSCLPPDLSRSYNGADDVFRARVLTKLPWRRGLLLYFVRIEQTYKGCRKPGAFAMLMTTPSGASCGVTWLERGERALLTAHQGTRRFLHIQSCDYNTAWSNLSDRDIHFLDTRYNCCGATCGCVNAPQVQCFADPCAVSAPCDVEGAECVSNYCGGCNAEWYDPTGALVCEAEDDFCASDDDCFEDTWCRPTQDDPNLGECVPFQQEGEWCGGYTPIWAQSRCEPGLICTDTPRFIADAPGICREPCDIQNGIRWCSADRYCSPNNDVCRDDGACYRDDDCEAPGNDYPHIECVGYGVCNDGQCGWECGNPACRDLRNVDFGFCDALLGWGVVDGSCRAISGCPGQAEGYRLYKSQRACEFVCGSGLPECRATGCSSQICADREVFSTCEWRPEYGCYQKFGHCERQSDGACDWSDSRDLLACLDQYLE